MNATKDQAATEAADGLDDAAAGSPSGDTAQGPEPTVLLAPLLAIATLLAISVPGWTSVASQLCVAGWVGLSVLWAVMTVRRTLDRRAGRPRHRPFWTIVVLPGFLAIVLFLAAAEIPVRARFILSRNEMTDAANAVLEARASEPPGRIGSFPIQSIETNGVTVSFLTSGFGTTNRWGFLYAPNGLTGVGGVTLSDVGDHWYIFHEGNGRFPPG